SLSYGGGGPPPGVAGGGGGGGAGRGGPRGRGGAGQPNVGKNGFLGENGKAGNRKDPPICPPAPLKGGGYRQHTEEAPNEQPRADEQDAGEGDLRNHQPIADPGVPLAAG